jgi:hypothetical protein
MHMDVCNVRGITAHKRSQSQIGSFDQVAEVAWLEGHNEWHPSCSMHNSDIKIVDLHKLAGERVVWQLPGPGQSPQGWAERAEPNIMQKSSEQLLYLVEEFLESKEQGRHARKKTTEFLDQLLLVHS